MTASVTPRPSSRTLTVSGVHDREQDRPFNTFTEQLAAVRAATETRAVDPRLIGIHEAFAAASGSSETVMSDGGFLVQPTFAAKIFDEFNSGAVISRVTRVPLEPDATGWRLSVVDETNRATGSRFGGVQAYWINEADTVTASKPKYRRIQLDLGKLMGITNATNELVFDARAATDAVTIPELAKELTFMAEDAIINGTGAGQPLGILNSGCLIVQPSSAGGANTIKIADVSGMLSRLYPGSLATAVWFVNMTTLPQLYTLAAGASVAVSPGTDAAPFGRLFGLPIVPIEQTAQLGTVGDCILADPSCYLLAEKGGPQTVQSIHVRFINDESVFRFSYRVTGAPRYAAPITQFKGGTTSSPFIAFTSTRT